MTDLPTYGLTGTYGKSHKSDLRTYPPFKGVSRKSKNGVSHGND